MNIDWNHFTPWASLIGGLLLGVASAVFILINGRILGISGILGGLLPPKVGDIGWRVAFLLGMLAAPTVFMALAPAGFASEPRIDAGFWTVIAAGLLVGMINIVVITCLALLTGNTFSADILIKLSMGIIGGVVSGIIVAGIAPLFESLLCQTPYNSSPKRPL